MKKQNTYLLSAISVFFLIGCQSTQDSAYAQQKAILQWQSMADSAATPFREAGIQLTAKLNFKDAQWGKEYYLSDFSFTKPIDKYRIDLLAPTFKNKYLCSWVCEKVDEMRYDKLIGYYDYLTVFFNTIKPELLTFYSNLIELENNVNTLNISKQEFAVKLHKLKQTPIELANLTQVDNYLESSFTQTSFFDVEESEVITNESDIYTTNEEQTDFEADNENTVNDSDIIAVSTYDNADEFVEQTTEDIGIDKSLFTIGIKVCSRQANFFGEVMEVDPLNPKILVSVKGQAKQMKDNAIVNLASGYLESQNGQFDFIEMNKMTVFNLDDIFLCDVAI